jgi:hemoglobin/transferrin/lactoferrin receptor protein
MGRVCILILLCGMVFTRVNAQDKTETDSTYKAINLNEVIVSANKFAEKRVNVAQQVEIIKAKQLQMMNAQSSGDALMMTGNIFVQKSQQGGSSPVIRGFEASRVLLVIDGVRMNNAIYRSGHLQNVITVDNNMIDRIEVLYGPSSTVYGSDALGGVVHFRTKNPTLATDKKFYSYGNAFFRYGNVNNELTGHIDFNLAGRKFGSLTSVTYSKFGDLKQGGNFTETSDSAWLRTYYAQRFYRPDSTSILGAVGYDSLVKNNNPLVQKGSGYTQYDILQKFMFQQNERISHVLNFQFSNSSNIPRYDRLNLPGGLAITQGEWYYGPQFRLMGAYEFNYSNPGGKLDAVNVGVSYQKIQESRHTRGFGSNRRTSRIEDLHVGAFHANFKKVIKKHDVYFGAEGQFNVVKSRAYRLQLNTLEVDGATTRYPDGKNNMNYAAIYATHTWEITPKVILSDGLRYNFVNLRSTFEDTTLINFPFSEAKQINNALSGNVGLVFLPGAGFRIATMFSSGFRSPNIDDLGRVFDTQPGAVIVPNDNLKPEYTINIDLTISKTFGDKVRLEATGYYTRMFDAITIDNFTFNGQDSIEYDGVLSKVLANQNKRQAHIAGVYAGFNAQITPWLAFDASVNYIYGRILTDSVPYPLDHIPPIHGKAGLTANYKGFYAQFFTLFNGAKKIKDYNLLGEDNQVYTTKDGSPAWFTLNTRVGFKFKRYFGIDLGVDNILDRNYRNFASGISAPGRNFFVTLRTGF